MEQISYDLETLEQERRTLWRDVKRSLRKQKSPYVAVYDHTRITVVEDGTGLCLQVAYRLDGLLQWAGVLL